MSSLNAVLRKVAEYRICLERDAEREIISRGSALVIERFYSSLATDLEHARYELEGAGLVGSGGPFRQHLVAGYARLARTMFLAMYRDDNPGRLSRLVLALEADARTLMEQLRIRVESAA